MTTTERRVQTPTAIGRDTISVSEIFGPTVQGEGPSAGRRCGFLRLGLCNLDCSWCDTAYTWDWTRYNRQAELTDMTFAEVQTAVEALGVDRLVISGGEPLVQGRRLTRLAKRLHEALGLRIEVETNGTLDPGDLFGWVNQWVVSPKLAHSGVARSRAWKPDVLRKFVMTLDVDATVDVAFKFVCRSPRDDFPEIRALVDEVGIPASAVWIMPEGRSAFAIAKGIERLADATVAAGWNLTGRLHVFAWGDARGT